MKILLLKRLFVSVLFLIALFITNTINAQCTNCSEGTASLEACDEGGGTATFDLTSVGSGDRNYYESCTGSGDLATSIGSPASFTGSNGQKVYVEELDMSMMCTQITEVTLTVNSPSVDITPTDPIYCPGSTVTLTANISNTDGTVSYQWKRNGSNIGGGTSDTYDADQEGDYTVEITDDNCTVESTPAVTVSESTLDVAITGNPSSLIICIGDDVVLTANVSGENGNLSYQWKRNGSNFGGTGSTLTLDENDITGSSDMFSVEVVDDDCTVESSEVEVSLNTFDVSITPDGGAVCEQADLTLTANPMNSSGTVTYQWKRNGNNFGGTMSTLTLDDTDINGNNDDFSVEATDDNCTVESAEVRVEDNNLMVNVTPNGGEICSGPLELSANVSGAEGTVSYQWKLDGSNIGGATSSTYDASTPGEYSVTVMDDECTFDSEIETVTASSLTVEIMASPSNLIVCPGDNVVLTANVSGESGSVSYQWKRNGSNFGGTGSTLTLDDSDINGLSDDFSVEVEDDNCTVESSEVTVTVNSLDITLTPMDPACSGGEGSIEVNISSGNSPFDIAWGGEESGSDTDISDPYTIPDLNPGSYMVTVTDDDGCDISKSTSITNPDPFDFIASGSPTCPGGQTGSISISDYDNGASPYDIAWSGPENGSINDQGNFTIPDLRQGTYTITVTDDNGCTKVEMEDVGVNNFEVDVTIVGDNTYCDSESTTTLTASSSASITNYDWSNNDDTPSINVGEGTYSVTVTDTDGCTGSDGGFSVTQLPPINVNLLGSSELEVTCSSDCDGSINITVSGGSGSGYSFSWTGPDGYTSDDEDISGLCTGSYTLTVTDSDNCTGTFTQSITTPDPIMISIGVEEPISCFGEDDGELRATASGGTGTLDYSWSNGDNVAIANNLSAGTYIVTVTDDNNCFDTKEFTITEPAQVPASITTDPSPAEICLNDEIELRANTGAGFDYEWNFSGANNDDRVVTVQPDMNGETYIVTVTDNNNCFNTASISIVVNPLPDAIITVSENSGIAGDEIICEGGSVTLNGSGGVNFDWTAGGSGSSVTYTPQLGNNTYGLLVTDANGCTDETEVEILVRANPIAKIDDRDASKFEDAAQIFYNISESASADCQIVECFWLFDNGTNSENCDLEPSEYPIYSDPGNYNISLMVTDECGCSDTDPLGITIADQADCNVTAFIVNNNEEIACVNETVPIVINRRSSENNTCAFNEQLSFVRVTPDQNYTISPNDMEITFTKAGTYTLQYELQDQCNCATESGVRTLIVEDLPTAEFIMNTVRVCEGEDAVFNIVRSSSENIVTVSGFPEGTREYNSNIISVPNITQDLSLEIVEVSNSNCDNPSPSGSINLNIDFIPKFEADEEMIVKECNDEGTLYEVTINTTGGNGNIITMLSGGDLIAQNNGTSLTTIPLNPNDSYVLEFKKGDVCDPVMITLDPFICDCAVRNFGSMGDIPLVQCETEPAIANFTPGLEFNAELDQVFYALHTNAGDALGEVLAVSKDPVFLFDPETMQYANEGFVYRISAVGYRDMRPDETITPELVSFQGFDDCLSVAPGIIAKWYQTPSPQIEGPLSVCQNQYDVKYSIPNRLDGSNISFDISGLSGESVRQYGNPNNVYLHFNGNQDSYTIIFNESITYIDDEVGQVTCSAADTIVVQTTSEIAPDLATIIRWPGNIYACTADNVLYQWGTTDIQTGNEFILAEEKGKYYFAPQGFVLGDDQLLWVDISNDAESSCPTRIYFNADGPPGFEIKEGEGFELEVFPNPSNGQFKLVINSSEQGNYKLDIFNTLGKHKYTEMIFKEFPSSRNNINISNFKPGIYYLRVQSENTREVITEKVIVH